MVSIEAASGAPTDDDSDNSERQACFLNRTALEWLDFLPSWSVISLYVIAGKHWNGCAVIPSVNEYLVVFPTVVLAYDIIKFVGRTEMLKKQGGPFWPWVYLEALLTVTLLACGIWGALLTFGNFDLKGNGPEECATAAFLAVFVSVCINFFIFAAVFVFIIYMIIKEVKKEMAREAALTSEKENDETNSNNTDVETPETTQALHEVEL